MALRTELRGATTERVHIPRRGVYYPVAWHGGEESQASCFRELPRVGRALRCPAVWREYPRTARRSGESAGTISELRAHVSLRPNTAPTGSGWRKPVPGMPIMGDPPLNFGRGFGFARFSHSASLRCVRQDQKRQLAHSQEAV
jgi:hypothetical protein